MGKEVESESISTKPVTIVSVKSANTEMNKILESYNKSVKEEPGLSFTLLETVPYIPPVNCTLRDNIQNLTAFMDIAEENMDLRRGIIRQTQTNVLAHIGANAGQKSDVIIRDARKQTADQASLKPEDTPESWVIAAAARARGALKLIEMGRTTGGNKEANAKAQEAALQIFEGYKKRLQEAPTPKEKESYIQEMDYELSFMLKHSGLKIGNVDLAKCSQRKEITNMLADARDSCNFEQDNHPSIVTITSNLSPDGSKTSVNQVITSIPTTPCAMREKYFGATMKQQSWYTSLHKSANSVKQVRAALTDSYQDKIADGKHVTPTQLRWLPGTANTYVHDVSYLINGVQDQEKGFASLRTAAPVYGRGNGQDTSLTNDNIQHLNSLVGRNGKYVGLNSDTGIIAGLIGQKSEQNITDGMLDAAGERFVSAPISVSRNKNKNLEKATSIILGKDWNHTNKISKWNRITKIFCKSGKDRTQAVIEEAGLNNAHEVVQAECKATKIMPSILLETSLKVKQAAHGETMSGGNGSTRGSFGTKIGNVYGSGWIARLTGMKLTRGLILGVKSFATNRIKETTAMTRLKDPVDPVLPALQATKIGKKLGGAKDTPTTRSESALPTTMLHNKRQIGI